MFDWIHKADIHRYRRQLSQTNEPSRQLQLRELISATEDRLAVLTGKPVVRHPTPRAR